MANKYQSGMQEQIQEMVKYAIPFEGPTFEQSETKKNEKIQYKAKACIVQEIPWFHEFVYKLVQARDLLIDFLLQERAKENQL